MIDMLYIKIVVLDFDLFTKKVRANTIKEKLIKAKNESNLSRAQPKFYN